MSVRIPRRYEISHGLNAEISHQILLYIIHVSFRIRILAVFFLSSFFGSNLAIIKFSLMMRAFNEAIFFATFDFVSVSNYTK